MISKGVKKYALIALFFILAIAVLSFAGRLYISSLTMPAKFEDQQNKLWKHACNDTSKLDLVFHSFQGVEFDVNFDTTLQDFDVRHDYDTKPQGVNLDAYFSSIKKPENHFYWLDFKNLTPKNAEFCALKLSKILLKYNITDRVFVESQSPEALGVMSGFGLNTSYWIPHFEYSFLSKPHQVYAYFKITLSIAHDVRKYEIDAISAHCNMHKRLKQYFPNMNIHLWTNKYSYPKDSTILCAISNDKNVKVILVDNDNNWHLSRK